MKRICNKIKMLFALWKLWSERAWAIFGIFALICGLTGLPDDICCKVILITCLILVSVIISAIWTVWERKSVLVKIDGQTILTIKYGDLWACKGAIVIPVNDYFDTHVGDGIISERTLHGQFIRTVYNDDENALKNDIENAIRQQRVKQIGVNNSRGYGLPTSKYEIGSCIRIYHEGNLYILVVTSRFDNNNHAELKSSEYPLLLDGLYRGVLELNDDNPVYLPLIGSGQAGTGCSQTKLLSAMVSNALFADNLTIHNGINIILYPKAKVNLDVIDYLYNKINLNKIQ